MQITPLLTAAILAGAAAAHPGEKAHHVSRAAELSRREFKAAARRGLDACSSKLQARGEAAALRRADKAAAYRERALATRREKRDTDGVLATDHNATASLGYTLETPEATVFATNATCVLTPEGETGPYWVKGELVRSDLVETQEGVPVVLEAQFVDVETCEPLTDLYW